MKKPELKTREAKLEYLLKTALDHLKRYAPSNNEAIKKFSKLSWEEIKDPDGTLVSMNDVIEFITGMLDASVFLSQIIGSLGPSENVKKSINKVLNTLSEGITELQDQLGELSPESPEVDEDEVIR